MVKKILLLFFLCLLVAQKSEALDIIVESAINPRSGQANYPLEGTLTVTHSQQEKVDPTSVTFKGKPLQVTFTQDVLISSPDTWISIYSFQLPAQEQGLYELDPISIKVAGKVYQSIASTYEVKGTQSVPSVVAPATKTTSAPTKKAVATPSTKTAPGPVVFRLEATAKGPTTLYPGERTHLFYRILYNRSVDLTESQLPFVHPPHFEKIGDVHIQDLQEGEMTVQELDQEIEARELGTFTLGPSSIAGYAYTMSASGQKTYQAPLLKSEVSALTIEVKPFPKEEKPASFNGALGKIEAQASLLSNSSLAVGDLLRVQLNVKGIQNLADLHLPPLSCQPGFSGFFQLSDLPPVGEIKEETKIFQIELRPLSTLITQLPAIELASFDPKQGTYVVQQTKPLDLVIRAPVQEEISPTAPSSVLQPVLTDWPTPLLAPLAFQEEKAPHLSLGRSWFSTGKILWLLPLLLLGLFFEKEGLQLWQNRPRVYVPRSEQLLQQATDVHTLEQALWWRLWEKNILPKGDRHLEALKKETPFETIRSFILQLQVFQYSDRKDASAFDFNHLKQQTLQLFKSL